MGSGMNLLDPAPRTSGAQIRSAVPPAARGEQVAAGGEEFGMKNFEAGPQEAQMDHANEVPTSLDIISGARVASLAARLAANSITGRRRLKERPICQTNSDWATS